MSAPDASAALAAVGSIPRDAGQPVFPAPWAARAFALAVALNGRGLFGWGEWSETLGPHVRRQTAADAADPEAYWRAWLAALEDVLARRHLADADALAALREAWREAAARTPHGEPVELRR